MGREVPDQPLALQGKWIPASWRPRRSLVVLPESDTDAVGRPISRLLGASPRTANSSLHDLNSSSSVCLSFPANIGVGCRVLCPRTTADWGGELGLFLARRCKPTVEAAGQQKGHLRTGSEGDRWKKGGVFGHRVTAFSSLPHTTHGGGPSVPHGSGEEGDEERRNPPEPLMNQAGHPQDPCTNVSGGYPMATIHSYTLRRP